MDDTNVVNLAAWAEPSNALVALCDQATAVFAETTRGEPTRRDDPRLVSIATELMAALNRLENLPPVGGTIGRAVEILTHVDAHRIDDVLDAIAQLRRVSAMRLSAPTDTSTTHQAARDEPEASPPVNEPAPASTRSRRRSRPPQPDTHTPQAGVPSSPTLPGLEATKEPT